MLWSQVSEAHVPLVQQSFHQDLSNPKAYQRHFGWRPQCEALRRFQWKDGLHGHEELERNGVTWCMEGLNSHVAYRHYPVKFAKKLVENIPAAVHLAKQLPTAPKD